MKYVVIDVSYITFFVSQGDFWNKIWNEKYFRDVKIPWVIDTILVWAAQLCEHHLSSNEICKALIWIEVI